MANVQLLDGNDVSDALERPGVDLFRYQLNRLGFTLILAVGGLMLAGAGYVWWDFGFDESFWTAIFAGLAAGGLALSLHAAYWYTFASTHLVGISDRKLIIGSDKKAWSIDWAVLDADNLGLTQMNATAMGGALEVNVGGEEIKIHLYNAYVFLEDIQALMSGLLERLQKNQPPADSAPDESLADDDLAGDDLAEDDRDEKDRTGEA